MMPFYYSKVAFLILLLFSIPASANNTDISSGKETKSNTLQLIAELKELTNKKPRDAILLGEKLLDELVLNTFDDRKTKVDIYNQLAHASILAGDYSNAFKYAKEGKLLAETIDYSLGRGLALKNIAHFYIFIDDYETALDYYIKALEYVRIADNGLEIALALSNIGQLYSKIGENDESIAVFVESLEILNKMNDKRALAYTLGAMAEAYRNKGLYEDSLELTYKSLEILIEIDDRIGLVISYNLVGDLQLQSGNLLEAKQNFERSLSLAKKNNIFSLITMPYIGLAKMATTEKNYPLANEYAQNALTISSDRNELNRQVESLSILSQIAEVQNNFSMALKYLKQQKEIEREMFNNNSDRNISLLRTSFEVDKLDRKNQLLEKQNELIQINIEKQKNQKLIILIFSLLVVLSIAFAYYRFVHNKKLQQEKLINEQLQSINQLKDQILMNTSHEFRTPLTGIIGLAECLKEELMGPQTDESKQNLALIVDSGRRLNALVDDILSFAQLKSGNFEINISAIDIYKPIVDVVTTCAPLINGKSITINNTIQEGQFTAQADEKRLVQILFNLIGNAIKYSNQGEIKIFAEESDEQIKISISDQGIGIPEDKLEFIFEYFEQIDASSSRTQQGSGLGLAIAKRLVELQNGNIAVVSKLNEGSVFSFTLPRTINIPSA